MQHLTAIQSSGCKGGLYEV